MSTIQRKSDKLSLTRVLLVAVPGALLVGIAALMLKQSYSQPRSHPPTMSMLSSFENARGVPLKLADEFRDSNDDLIADEPPAGKTVEPDVLHFVYLTHEDEEDADGQKINRNLKTAAEWADFTALLEKKTGKTVKYDDSLKSEHDQIEALKAGKLHICGASTGMVVNMVNAAGFVPAYVLGAKNGTYSYQMKILASPKSNVTKPDQIIGHRLTLTSIGSNSGYKAPLVLLRQEFRLQPTLDYEIAFSGGHEESLRGLADGTCELVAVASDMVAREMAKGTLNPDQFVEVYASDFFPPGCMGYRYDLSPDLVKKIREAFDEFDIEGSSLAKDFVPAGQTRFVPINYKEAFGLVRSMDKAVREFGDVTQEKAK